ncbi:hypothetical protein GCM10007874_46160 [Labrys miyagiensis]|uniref:Uncharacterized protein n=1 Tax=Labrys miyagiensis TaxID=346912 RepID=A0ABQ6CS96_9HYPH|nr:hypothetical protein GCM10007874_46160 [Labrys miyagiensis]
MITLPNGKECVFLADVPFALAETAHLANPEGPRRSVQIVMTLPEGGAHDELDVPAGGSGVRGRDAGPARHPFGPLNLV